MKQNRNDKLLQGIAIVAKNLREKKNLSQEEVMNDIKIQKDINIHLGRLETAAANISVSSLSVICEYYDISISRFLVKVEKVIRELK